MFHAGATNMKGGLTRAAGGSFAMAGDMKVKRGPGVVLSTLPNKPDVQHQRTPAEPNADMKAYLAEREKSDFDPNFAKTEAERAKALGPTEEQMRAKRKDFENEGPAQWALMNLTGVGSVVKLVDGEMPSGMEMASMVPVGGPLTGLLAKGGAKLLGHADDLVKGGSKLLDEVIAKTQNVNVKVAPSKIADVPTSVSPKLLQAAHKELDALSSRVDSKLVSLMGRKPTAADVADLERVVHEQKLLFIRHPDVPFDAATKARAHAELTKAQKALDTVKAERRDVLKPELEALRQQTSKLNKAMFEGADELESAAAQFQPNGIYWKDIGTRKLDKIEAEATAALNKVKNAGKNEMQLQRTERGMMKELEHLEQKDHKVWMREITDDETTKQTIGFAQDKYDALLKKLDAMRKKNGLEIPPRQSLLDRVIEQSS
jgi:hypothetical protein